MRSTGFPAIPFKCHPKEELTRIGANFQSTPLHRLAKLHMLILKFNELLISILPSTRQKTLYESPMEELMTLLPLKVVGEKKAAVTCGESWTL